MRIATWPQDAPRGAVTAFCAEHGISRSQFYELRKRAVQEGVAGALVPRSRRPLRPARATPAHVEDTALRIRKELAEQGLDNGPVSVRHRMLALAGGDGAAVPGVSTLAAIFRRRGAVVPQPQKRPRSSWRRFEFANVHDCWQLDAFSWPLADGTKVTIYQVSDDHSRAQLGWHVTRTENAAGAMAVVAKAQARTGRLPLRLLSDNGLAFNPSRRGHRGRLETHLGQHGVTPIASSPRHPQTCGKNERMHRTLQQWLRARPPAASTTELQTLLETFDTIYNTQRPHQALGRDGRTPAQALTDDPQAPLPAPATRPAPARAALADQRRATRAKVAVNGVVAAAGKRIHIGVEHAGTRVTAVQDGPLITIVDDNGEVLAEVQITPHQRYYRSGKTPGGHARPRRSSTM